MKNLVLISAVALTLGGCQTINTGVAAIASADIRLRDKCAYLASGVELAQLAVSFVPKAQKYVDQGTALAAAYCSGAPITDLSSALAAMERVIVAIRPVAAKVGN